MKFDRKEYFKKYYQEHKKERRKYNKKYEEEHREDHKEEKQISRAVYYQANKAKAKELNKKYREEHKEEIRIRQKKYGEEHKEEIRKQQKKYREEHKEEMDKAKRKYYQDHKEEIRIRQTERHKTRLKTDIQYKLAYRLRSRLCGALKKQQKAGSAVRDLGCSTKYLKKYLEIQFVPGMSWDNWGCKENDWSIDHIKPLSSFDLTDREQFLEACHYTNLQPMWHIENIRKGDKMEDKDYSELFTSTLSLLKGVKHMIEKDSVNPTNKEEHDHYIKVLDEHINRIEAIKP